MTQFTLSRNFQTHRVLMAVGASLILFNSLVINLRVWHWWPLRFVLAGYICLLPGLLILWLIGLKNFKRLTHGLYAVGLSLLYLMASGLLINQLLPGLGIQRPLEFGPLLLSWNGGVLIMLALAGWRRQVWRCQIRFSIPSEGWWFVLAASVLPLIMALGAFRLNNLASNSLTMVGLGLMLGLIGLLIWRQPRLPAPVIVYVLFCVGLSVLLMTSLRGYEVVGHDVKREFQVFSLTEQLGRWQIDTLRSAYNACLSITILPVSLAKLLDMNGLVVFKFLFQILFGLVPVVIYYILRSQISPRLALLGSLLFIAYPTFVNDSAMLTRQEIAFLFFGLQLLAWLDKDPAIQRLWRGLFLLFGAGLIVSHYSSSYFLAAVLVVAYVLYRVWSILGVKRFVERKTLTASMVLLMSLGTMLWYAQLTFTASGLTSTVSKSLGNIAHTFSDDNKSSDASASLFFATQKSRRQLFYQYAEQTRQQAGPAANQLTIQLADAGTLPLTRLGSWLQRLGVPEPGNVLVSLRQKYARFLQILALIGSSVLFYRARRQGHSAPPESLVVLAGASLFLLFLMVILPSVSLDYGLLRAFQQSAFYLLIPIMIGLEWLFRPLRRLAQAGQALFTIGVLALFLGFFGQIIGGVDAPLTLNNQGFIYGTFYTHATDVAGFKWMGDNLNRQASVAAVDFANAMLYQPLFPFVKRDLTSSADYLFLNYSPTVQRKVYQYFNGESLTTAFPTEYYTANRSLIYSTTQSQVWAAPW